MKGVTECRNDQLTNEITFDPIKHFYFIYYTHHRRNKRYKNSKDFFEKIQNSQFVNLSFKKKCVYGSNV